MAKAIVTFEDKDDGGLGITFEFDPPLQKGQATLTMAQRAGLEMNRELAGDQVGNAMDDFIDDE